MFKIQNAELALQILYEMTDERPGTQTLVQVSWAELDARMQSRGVSPADTKKAFNWLRQKGWAKALNASFIQITDMGADEYEYSDEGKHDPKVQAKIQNAELALQILYEMTDERPGTQTLVQVSWAELDARMQSRGVSPADTKKAFNWLRQKGWAKALNASFIQITKLGQREFESIFHD